jgi:hypothetical protein
MARGPGVVEHYLCVCECAWQQRVRPLTPDLPPYIRNPLS